LGIVTLESQAIYEISQIVGSALHLDKALSQILHVLNAILHMERAILVLLNETVCKKILQTCSPFVVQDIHSEPVFLNMIQSPNFLSKDEFSFIGVSIILHKKPVGVLAVNRLFDQEISFEEDIRFLTIVAILIAQFLKLHRTICRNKESLM
jgi:Nif-specific regulatory protein